MRTMAKISADNHDEVLSYICKCPAERCLHTCDMYLKRCLMSSGPRPEIVNCNVSNSCVNAISEEFGKVTLDAFLWDISFAG